MKTYQNPSVEIQLIHENDIISTSLNAKGEDNGLVGKFEDLFPKEI